jgi:hypothetical protein
MNADRAIVFARSRDGHTTQQFAHRVSIDGASACVGACDRDAAEFTETACAEWNRHAATLPPDRRRQLVAEAGQVFDRGYDRHYSIVHAQGAILGGRDRPPGLPAHPGMTEWAKVGKPYSLLLGPSATLALVDFILDGMPGAMDPAAWPFDAGLTIDDTGCSPYPPQHREDPTPQRIGPAVTVRDEGDDIAFMLLQRSEVWQRPVNALYNMRQRNLAIDCDDAVSDLSGPVVVLDTLSAEAEPTLARSSWLATWYLHRPDGSVWGRERLAVTIETSRVLRSGIRAAGRPQTACICDPIEGDNYGTAPALLISPASFAISVLS